MSEDNGSIDAADDSSAQTKRSERSEQRARRKVKARSRYSDFAPADIRRRGDVAVLQAVPA